MTIVMHTYTYTYIYKYMVNFINTPKYSNVST